MSEMERMRPRREAFEPDNEIEAAIKETGDQLNAVNQLGDSLSSDDSIKRQLLALEVEIQQEAKEDTAKRLFRLESELRLKDELKKDQVQELERLRKENARLLATSTRATIDAESAQARLREVVGQASAQASKLAEVEGRAKEAEAASADLTIQLKCKDDQLRETQQELHVSKCQMAEEGTQSRERLSEVTTRFSAEAGRAQALDDELARERERREQAEELLAEYQAENPRDEIGLEAFKTAKWYEACQDSLKEWRLRWITETIVKVVFALFVSGVAVKLFMMGQNEAGTAVLGVVAAILAGCSMSGPKRGEKTEGAA